MEDLYWTYVRLLSKLRDIPLLLLRFVLAYGFLEPALMKLKNFDNIVTWFSDTLHIPFPELNAYLATSTETLGVVLLTLGLGTRLIAVPLMVVMFVAITTVHWEHGFTCGKNGFEVPFYYLLMLLVLLVYGAGRMSVDYLISRWRGRKALES